MKHINITNFFFILIVSLFCLSNITIAQANKNKVRKVSFTYKTVVSNIPEDAHKVSIWLPIPSSDSYQEITNLSIECPFPINISRDKKYDNCILFIDATENRGPEIIIKVSFNVKRREYHAHLKSSDKIESNMGLNNNELTKFLLPSRLAIIDDNIKSIAFKVTKNEKTQIQKARAIYDYLIQKMEYNKNEPGWGAGDTKRAIKVCKGNCSDFHSAFTSLAQAIKIPSKFQYGFALPKEPQGDAIAHCWAQFYTNSTGWVPVDISEADKHTELSEYYFGNHDENRILFSTGRDIALEPKQNGELLNFFIKPYVEINGKPYSNVTLVATFNNLS